MKNQTRAEKRRPPKVAIAKLPTGVRGLDDILGGGIPEFSFNVIAGAPGSGKTTMAHQIMFANATARAPALYFTALGEPALKMLRYQQQFTFFDEAKVGKAVRFIDLSALVLEGDLDAVLAEIIEQVTATHPSIVVVDSFRSVMRKMATTSDMAMQSFIQRLTQFLTSWQATTFLIGEYGEEETRGNPLFTVVDGLFWLSQKVERNSVVRKLQILKVRGLASVPGLHTIRIGEGGVQAFSRTLGFGGGVLEGDSLLIAGPSGTGKSALATQFIAAGLRNGEPGVMAIFEERPRGYIARADSFGLNLKSPQAKGKLEIVYLRPLDLSVDETMQEILDAVERVGAKRLVIDSLVSLDGAGARLPRGFPRVALPHDRGADRRGGHDPQHRRGRGQLHRIFLQPLYDLVPDRRHHPAALRRDRRPAAQGHGRDQDARRQSQQGHPRIRHHRQGCGRHPAALHRLRRTDHRDPHADRPAHAASSPCGMRGPVRVGIPVVSP